MLCGSFLSLSALAVADTADDLTAIFDSEFAAVTHAAERFNPVSVQEDREFMGGIYRMRIQGGTRYGYTVGAGGAGEDSVTVSFSLPAGATLVAFWHTHGAPHWTRQYFSAVDTELADSWQLPFYLATPSGELKVYRPGSPTLGRLRARRLGLGNSAGFAAGSRITPGLHG